MNVKIGVYDPYLDDTGGGERYMATIASCLSKDNSVTFFWDKSEDLQKVKERFDLDLSEVNLAPNIFLYPFKKKLLESKKYDAIIVLSDGSIPFLLSKKLYLHIQQPIGSIKLSIKDKAKMKKVEKVIVNSKFTKEFIDKTFGVDSFLLYPPVTIFQGNAKKENLIAHVGRFRGMNVNKDDYKKQQFMISTFKEMVDNGLKDWKFLLCISLPDEKDENFLNMKKSAEGYPIEFLINSKKNLLWEKCSKARIYWHATGYGEDLKAHPEFSEHFGISTVEAMSTGAVPVVINAGGQREIVTDNQDGLLWDTKEEFKKKTLSLIENGVLMEKLSKQARIRAKDFDESSFCKNVKSCIQ